MPQFNENLNIYIDQLDLFNSLKESFKNLKSHTDNLHVTFEKEEHFKHLLEPNFNKFIVFSSNWKDILSFATAKDLSTVAMANHLDYNVMFSKISQLGFQRQICDIQDIRNAELGADFNYSLGLLTAKEELVALELRSVDIAVIDLSVLAKLPLNLATNCLLTGMSLEKFIQLITFCTNSPSFKGVVFNTSNLNFQNLDHLSEIFSTIIWYIAEGITTGPIEFDPTSISDILLVTLKDVDQDLEFIHQNGNYWVKLSNESGLSYPCTHAEYEDGVLGNLSPRLFKKLFI